MITFAVMTLSKKENSIMRICITGGPGSGKTSVIDALAARGYTTLPEVSRQIIAEARATGVAQPFLDDAKAFSLKLLNGRIDQHALAAGGMTFFDRGIPDVIAYHHYLGEEVDSAFAKAAQQYCYNHVFLLPPWQEIYVQDTERYESYEQAVQIYQSILHTYKDYGYQPVIIQKGSVQDRVNRILGDLSKK